MGQSQLQPGELDANAVERFYAGDAAAFDELASRYYTIVYALCYSVLEDVAAAEDVTQEAFLKAYQQLESLRQPSRFAPWLKTLAVRQCWAWAKAERRRYSVSPAGAEALLHDPFVDEMEREEQNLAWIDRIETAVQAISDDHCCILGLFYVRGMSHEQIAHFLDIPLGTVKRRLHDARQSLQQSLGAGEIMPGDRDAKHRFLVAFHQTLAVRTVQTDTPVTSLRGGLQAEGKTDEEEES